MKNHSLKFASALLATTALSAVASAATIKAPAAQPTALGTVAVVAASLSAQVFPTANPQNLVIGGAGAAYSIDFTNSLTTNFNARILVSGATINAAVAAVEVLDEAASGTLTVITVTGCAVQVLTDRILIQGCTQSSTLQADVIELSGVNYTAANGLATAGTSITLAGNVTDNNNVDTFELITTAAVVTSVNSATVSGGVAATQTINPTAVPAFTRVGAATSAALGSVTVTGSVAVGTDLATAITTTVAGGLEFVLTHGVLTDAAVTSLDAAGGVTAPGTLTTTSFQGSTASFSVAAAGSVGAYTFTVRFDGTTAISAWPAGTVATEFTAGGFNNVAPADATTNLNVLARGGFAAQLNTVQSSTAAGGTTTFQSYIRITNNGAVAGAPIVTVTDGATGAALGSFTAASIPAGATLQLSNVDLETLGAFTSNGGQYTVDLSGPLTAYAQHVMLNSTNNYFTDLTGFRNAGAGNTP